MKYKLIARAGSDDFEDLAKFGTILTRVGDTNSHTFEKVFETEREARQYLAKRAVSVFTDYFKLRDAIRDIHKNGILIFGSVACTLEEIGNPEAESAPLCYTPEQLKELWFYYNQSPYEVPIINEFTEWLAKADRKELLP